MHRRACGYVIEESFKFIVLASNRMKRASPVVHHQRPGMMYSDMNDDMMFAAGPSSSGSNNERNLTPLSRHRADEGL